MDNEAKQKVDNRPIIVQWLERDKVKEKDKAELPANILTKIKQKKL